MILAATKSADDTQALAAALTEVVRPRDVVMLVGDVGAGKTTFTQGFGRALGVQEAITSPTFVLLRTYGGTMPLHHVDIYRVEHLQEVIDLGLLELLDEGGVALVEWGDLAEPVLPRDYLEVRLGVHPSDDDSRQVQVRGVGPDWSVREQLVGRAIAQWVVEGGQGA